MSERENWKPIATAPKDGRSCFVWASDNLSTLVVAFFQDGEWCTDYGHTVFRPTHWRYPPDPPP